MTTTATRRSALRTLAGATVLASNPALAQSLPAPSPVQALCDALRKAQARERAAYDTCSRISDDVCSAMAEPPALLTYDHPENVALGIPRFSRTADGYHDNARNPHQHVSTWHLREIIRTDDSLETGQFEVIEEPERTVYVRHKLTPTPEQQARRAALKQRLVLAEAYEGQYRDALARAGLGRAEKLAQQLADASSAIEAELTVAQSLTLADVLAKVRLHQTDPGLFDGENTRSGLSLGQSIIRDLAELQKRGALA